MALPRDEPIVVNAVGAEEAEVVMSPERWKKVQEVLLAALDCEPGEREAFLEEACGEGAGVAAEVRSLIEAHERAGSFLSQGRGEELRQDFGGQVLGEALADFEHLTRPVPEADPHQFVGRRVRQYEVEVHLGGGSMGVVYRARDTKLDRPVALKFLPPHLSTSKDAKRRFVREAKAASALDHPNICAVHEIGETVNGQLFIAMTYYEGETLKAKIARGPLPVEEAIDYAVQIAEGLAKAHGQGIVHRDVKPANVMVTAAGEVKLVDFGLAKLGDVTLTRTGQALGTAAYMSPEQARGEAIDKRTDLWSLGVLLYELLSGERPFSGTHPHAVIYSILHESPESLTTRRSEVYPKGLTPEEPLEALEEVVDTLLQKDSGDRYPSAGDLLADLYPLRDGAQPPERRWRRIFKSKSKRRAIRAVGLAVLLALIGGLVGHLFFGTAIGYRSESVVNVARALPPVSVAVLPLKNRSAEASEEHFADGMTDAIIANLTRIEALRVVSWTSALRYKDTDASQPQIAEELGVQYVVDGAVLSSRDSVWVTASLVEAEADRVLWTKSFTREMRNVLALQREVAWAVAEGMEVKLAPETEARLAEAPEVDPEAYRYYQRGVQLREEQTWNERERWSWAVGHFKRAVAIDSSFALAWASLGQALALLEIYSAEDFKPEAEQAVKQALALDPDLADAYTALGLIRAISDFDWTGAEEARRRAIELSPGNREAHITYGFLLFKMGRTEEAVAAMKRALALDPLASDAHHGLLWAYRANRQYEEAIEHAQRALKIEPSHAKFTRHLALAYLRTGQYEEAEATFRQFAAIVGWDYESSVDAATIHAKTGQREKALAWIDAQLAEREAPTSRSERKQRASNLITCAQVYGNLGEVDPALDALEEAYRLWPRNFGFAYLISEESYDPLRNEPRFQALLKKVGLDTGGLQQESTQPTTSP